MNSIKWKKRNYDKGASRSRIQSNQWISDQASEITGNVLSIGSGHDKDGEGNNYRDYFTQADSYTTSDLEGKVDLILDIRELDLPDKSYDCLFVAGVLEHIDDLKKAVSEMERVLRDKGIILVGVPFRQPIHMEDDYWRFTENALRYLFKNFNIQEIKAIDTDIDNFPVSYWLKATMKKNRTKVKTSDGRHTSSIRGGAQPMKQASRIGKNVTQKISYRKSPTKKKMKPRKRGRSGAMEKKMEFKPFMM
jgi:SAM-dependent methyltransferase